MLRDNLFQMKGYSTMFNGTDKTEFKNREKTGLSD